MDAYRPEPARQLPDHVRDLIADLETAYRPEHVEQPAPITAFRDETPSPRSGETDTAPVLQPEAPRLVPQWAAGLAVASLGVGAGATGLGCAAWLVFKGLALVSLPSLQTFAAILLAPFAGVALVAVAVGAAVAKTRRSSTTHVYEGPVTFNSKTEVSSTARGMFARNRNDLRGRP